MNVQTDFNDRVGTPRVLARKRPVPTQPTHSEIKPYAVRTCIWKKKLTMHDQIMYLAQVYLKHGRKSQRRSEVWTAIVACNWISREHAVNDVRRIGSKHIVSYWRAHRELDDSTRLARWRAFCVFYQLIGRSDEPPMPRTIQPLEL